MKAIIFSCLNLLKFGGRQRRIYLTYSQAGFPGWAKNGTVFLYGKNFIKYQPIFKILSLSESGGNL